MCRQRCKNNPRNCQATSRNDRRMQAPAQNASSLAGRLAEDLLKAWIAGDRLRIETELESSICVPFDGCDGAEEERRQLLKAVAARMWDCRHLPENHGQSPDVELCLNLLGHLVSAWPRSALQPN